MLEYLTPSTLREVYKDINDQTIDADLKWEETRDPTDRENLLHLNGLRKRIASVYKINTGHDIVAEIEVLEGR